MMNGLFAWPTCSVRMPLLPRLTWVFRKTGTLPRSGTARLQVYPGYRRSPVLRPSRENRILLFSAAPGARCPDAHCGCAGDKPEFGFDDSQNVEVAGSEVERNARRLPPKLNAAFHRSQQ